MTLFFGQLFVTVANNGNRISILGFTRGYNITNGPNGIANIDPFHLFGHRLEALSSYYYVALAFFLVVLAAVYLVSNSRTGRAWRSLREDSLAAEMMGMPVNRLKLYAFAFGAGVAGLTGTLFASLNTAVFSSDFDTPLLIIVYAIVILGGAGSMGGVIARRPGRQRLARGAAHAEPRHLGLLHADRRDPAREAPPVARARSGRRRDDRLRLRGPRDRRRDLAEQRQGAGRRHRSARRRAPALGADAGQPRPRPATGASSSSSC